jgi:predicted nucleic acid-binding protein
VLIALDTNVLLDLAGESDDVTEAMLVVRRRLRLAQLLMPPTVQEELAEEIIHADDFRNRERAQRAFELARQWNVHLHRMVDAQHRATRRMGQRLRDAALLPEEEVNDGRILAESALLGCALLLTSDEHLRGMDFERLTYELRLLGLAPPVIATPREIVRKFFH